MDTTTADWQTWAALAVVALTAIVFAIRIALRRGTTGDGDGGCAAGCGCAATKPKVKAKG